MLQPSVVGDENLANHALSTMSGNVASESPVDVVSTLVSAGAETAALALTSPGSAAPRVDRRLLEASSEAAGTGALDFARWPTVVRSPKTGREGLKIE